ncbi:MAG: response regulator [Melioribacteraceae bacterium]|nr:response regulator [Melioribacteraceae bacterium]
MKKILVVEDDTVLRENITIILEEEYSVIEAENGSKAISILEQDQNFDLILSDIMMPNVDGYELYDYTKSSEILSDIPFIFLTARADYSSIRKGMNLGVDDYIIKPFAIDDLLNGIKTRLIKKDKAVKKFEDLKNNISLFIPHELRRVSSESQM